MRADVLLLAVTALAAGCGGGSAGTSRGGPDGRTLFVQQCGGCHTLADAGTHSTFGPDLDASRPTRAAVAKAIADGKGTMSAHILGGQDARKVAAYVAAAARR